ncbi:tetratricopeptide repeat protein [Comamonas aquatica]|jgi:predicted O-linked N-acetylglucosamine transferase (SPINDLY family)|uniref:protein O-GlcNAc transferase n=1 Tax=Comamonas aquatica TaxID=225991 RepID=A0AA35GFJ9_9BURK|nr:tetratricopeptide repeat protein [Comamonas aquatica]CAB5677945.1 photosystem I assembly protein Ycf3 [Comamonas aquatica]CAB5682732.1 photosystem I assembly protein Ycf3 [Comamonas aquatica]CAC9180172.1 photosystem I assembly protein Ycf3 [Comamonas aquatica]CAC9678738.1 photosystem I assembly protein Ycf3 [Comamonas aquatica]
MKINNKAVNVAQTLESLPEDGMECAIYLQQQWRFEDARKKYEELLRGNPEDASALHNIGVLFSVQLLEPSTALPYFEAALNINPTRLQFWFSYIDALIKADALDVAEHVLSLASGYGLNDLQIASFERDIRLARTTVNDLVAVALKKAAPLPEPQPVQAVASVGDEPSIADLQQLLSLFNQKKYERAIKNASTLLVRFPTSASVWRLLAESEKRAGHWQKALEAYRQAASLLPADASAQMLWADALLGAGQQHEAAAVLQRILRMQPDYAAAHAKMGQVFQAQGALEEAVQSYARALQQEPNNPIFLEKFGATLRLQGDQDGALVCFKAAVDASPNSAELLDAYGVTLRNQERLGAAENAFRQALKIHPGYTQALRNLCHLLEVHGRFAEAEAGLLRCAEIDNESPESLYEIGRNLVQQKKEDEALEWLRRAIKAQPDYAAAHITLSAALNATEDPLAAMEEIKASIKVLPNIPHLHTNLGIVNLSLSRADDAIACFRKALKIAPNFSHARSSMLFALSHSTKITPEELYREHRAYGKLIEEEVKGKEYTTYTNSRVMDRPLKIGFVSADFRNHAVAKFVIPFFEELHKREGFITYAYSNHGAVDESMLRIKENMDVWRTVVQWSDDKLAEKIREDQIDILIDMSGHTAGDRLKVFARHPAPVQITWIGYPGTTGLKAMDYTILEDTVLPEENINKQFSEKIIYLPRAYTFDGRHGLQDFSDAPCLINDYLTFGSFNRLNKINREVISLWSGILNALPNSKLQMAAMPKSGGANELLKWFQEEGISEDRIYFYPRTGFSEYLKLHNQVDVCLDTFPYTGGTTTLHALWMGVPTLTLAGKTYPSYQGAALNNGIGLGDYFVALNKEEFIKKAIHLDLNKIFLNEIRWKIRSHLNNNYERDLEGLVAGCSAAFSIAWEKWCAKKELNGFSISRNTIDYIKKSALN